MYGMIKMALGVLGVVISLHSPSQEFISTRHEAMIDENIIINKVRKTVDIELTFYTGLICENTIYGSVDALENQLEYGTIAIPREFELGTQFYIDGYGIFTGTDRGSKKHIKIKQDGTIRIDMYIPRNKGENDDEYHKRVNNMGRVETTGYIINENEEI